MALRPFIGSSSRHSSNRKSASSHDAVRNTISNPARNASHARSSAGCSANSEAVASTAAISSGARSRKQQQRQKQLAHARVRGDGGKHGAGDHQPQRAKHQDQRQPADNVRERNVVEHGEDGNEDHLGDARGKSGSRAFSPAGSRTARRAPCAGRPASGSIARAQTTDSASASPRTETRSTSRPGP